MGRFFSKDATAQGVAKQRMIETLGGEGVSVIHDPYSERFVLGSGFIRLIGHKASVWLTKKFMPGFHEHLIARTKFIDDAVEDVLGDGFDQVVILGAGYDMRGHRLELNKNTKVYELDQVEVQCRKLDKMRPHFGGSNITYVPVDFSSDSLFNVLHSVGYDDSKSAIFILEGVSQYIDKASLYSTLIHISRLATTAKLALTFTYVDEKLRASPEDCFGSGYKNPGSKVELMVGLSSKCGEPWVSYYQPVEVSKMLTDIGYTLVEDKTLADVNEEYFGPVGRTLPDCELFNLERFVFARFD